MDIDIAYADSPNWEDSVMQERLTWLRENDPVHWSEKDGLWLITRYDDVVAVSKNQDLFTSGQGVRPQAERKIGLIDEPEPHHSELRRMLNKGFTPRMVAKLEDAFRKIVDEVLDAIADKDRCDFVDDIAVPLPLLIIAEMIGIRPEDRADFHRWSDTMMRADGNDHDAQIMAEAGQAFVEYSEYVNEIFEDRRKNPKDDLVSILVGADQEGSLRTFDATTVPDGMEASDEHLELQNSELMMLSVVLLIAGNETTRNAMSGMMQMLIEHPEEKQKLLDDPSLVPSAVEEALRLVSPVRTFCRTVTEDTVFQGREMKKGQKVMMIYWAANTDPRMYDDPLRFDVTRNPEHLAFGIGSHFCLGASLARMEMRVAFSEILRRFPDMEYADAGPEVRPHALVRSCMHMNVRYTPESGEKERVSM